jgi:predicted nucleotidyltransferase
MAESQDLKELLQCLNEAEVEYLIVGGYAVMKYAEPRFTKDLDLWVGNGQENAARVFHALAQFGAPLEQDGVTASTFCEDNIVYQIGLAPVRIDILTHITGVQFSDAWRSRVKSAMFGVPVHFISLQDLIANKQAMGRRADAEDLKKIQREKRK